MAVLLLRLLVPLAIPRFPLPGILAALALDGIDGAVFEAVGATVADYQSYDKAFDVYYLSIAYVATLRNWSDRAAFEIGRLLFYYRLVGVLAFELSGERALLLVFPNTFEYFFIAYEAIRLRWDPARLGWRRLVGMAAAIWILVKLPQEWWIHVAQLDFTDEVAAHPRIALTLAVVAAGLAVAAAPLARRLPPADWPPALGVDARVRRPGPAAVVARAAGRTIWTWALAEKVVLVATVAVIFAQVLPDPNATGVELTVAVAVVVVLDAAVSQWRLRRSPYWATTLAQFAAIAALNAGVAVAASVLAPAVGRSLDLFDALFFLLLLTLLVTLYDRYRVIRAVATAAPGRVQGRPAGGVPFAPAKAGGTAARHHTERGRDDR